MAPRPTGTLDSEVRADGTLAFRLRFRAYGERQAVFLHERRDCDCRYQCGGGWNERTARVELRKIITRVEAGVWEKPTRREAVRSVAPAEIPFFDDYIDYWLTARFNGVLGEKPLDANTRRDYRWRAVHLKRFFGRYRLDEIDRDLCLAFKAHKLREAQELRERLQPGADLRDARNRRVVPLVPTNRSATAFAFGDLTGVRITRTPSALKTVSKARVNLPSLSRIKNSRGRSRSGSENTKFLACWVGHAPCGFSVRPARCTRRVESSMKNST